MEKDANGMRVAEMKSVIDLAAMLLSMSTEKSKKILDCFLTNSALILGADRSCLILNRHDQLKIEAGFPASEHGLGLILDSETGSETMDLFMRKHKICFIENPGNTPEFAYMQEMIWHKGISGLLIVPLWKDSVDIGVIIYDFLNNNVAKGKNVTQRFLAHILVSALEAIEKRRDWEKETAHRERLCALGTYITAFAHNIRNLTLEVGHAQRLPKLADRIKKEMEDSGNSELLEKTRNFLEEITESAGIVMDAVGLMEKQSEEVLCFGKKIRIERECANLNAFLAQKIQDYQKLDEFSGVEFKTSFGRKINQAGIPFDKTKFSLCINDIFRNAREAGADKIRLQTCLDAMEKKALIRISNNGKPIDEPVIGQIFDPFFTTKRNGCGLGLPNVAKYIEAHDGRIEVRNLPEGGVEFTIRLPLY